MSILLKPQKPKHDEWAIRAELRRRGHTFQKLADASGFTASSIRAALVKPSTKVNLFIASTLGIPANELWPDWFDADGDLIPVKYRLKLSRARQRMASPELQAG